MIERNAVLHIPLSHYAFANSETNMTIRLRAAKGNLANATLHIADRADRNNPIGFTAIPMRLLAQDLYFEYFDATFDSPYTRVAYYFTLDSGDEQAIYYSDSFWDALPEERSEYYQYPFLHRAEIQTVPNWLKKSTVYNIFPDSFASGKAKLQAPKATEVPLPGGLSCKAKLGGTLDGVRENLDYIQGMGFTCIYLNPIFTAGESHKYDLLDYYHIDPCFGTDEDFAALVDAVHARGMRIIIDGVFNHCSWHFFAFEDVVQNGEASRYKDWFYDVSYPVVRPDDADAYPGYGCFAYERKMPKLNTANPETRDYFLDVARHWTEKYKLDGWRLDVANEVDKDFWRAFRHTVRGINPECVMIGEVWESAEAWLRGDVFDSTMNYDFRRHCRDFFARGTIDARQFNARMTHMLLRYPTGILHGQLNLLDSHDVCRFLSFCGGNERRLKTAAVMLALAPGVPSVFYGDERGIAGTTEDEYRQPMPWDKPHSLVAFYTQLMALRKIPAVQTGSYTALHFAQGSLVYAFAREDETGRVTAVINAGGQSAPLPAGLPAAAPALSEGVAGGTINAYGYAVWVE